MKGKHIYLPVDYHYKANSTVLGPEVKMALNVYEGFLYNPRKTPVLNIYFHEVRGFHELQNFSG